ncbi:MAG: repeat-containing protein [Pedosphaera sp.]|nr:repeat-containing protein [Pedosphaera sp.]
MDSVIFQHNTEGPHAWGGGTPPSHFVLVPGQSYLIFAEKTGEPGVFRQVSGMPAREDEGVTHTVDDRRLAGLSIKDAHWVELNRLLESKNSTNLVYAIQKLNGMCERCGIRVAHTDDFSREAVLKALHGCLTATNEKVALAAIECFQVGGIITENWDDQGFISAYRIPAESNCVAQLLPHADTLIRIASSAPSVARRGAAVAAFSDTKLEVVKQALPKWLEDLSEAVRMQAVLLLPDYPGDFSEGHLRKHAGDRSAQVRATVAEAIGNGKIEHLLPTLEGLLLDPVGRAQPLPPLTIEELQDGGRSDVPGDVHTSAGYALLKFDIEQVSNIIKANLNDVAFRPNYLCKLAEKDAGPWLEDLAEVMEARRARIEKRATHNGIVDVVEMNNLLTLAGLPYRCWRIVYDHLKALPNAEFADGKMDRYLNDLEQAGESGSSEPEMLYELFRMKGLNERAKRFRIKKEKSLEVYRIGAFFDKIDATYPNVPSNEKR